MPLETMVERSDSLVAAAATSLTMVIFNDM